MPSLGSFVAGYLSVDMTGLCSLLNNAQSHYNCNRAGTISNMGPPDLPNFAYSDSAFVRLLENYRDQYDYLVILTSVPIEDNFFRGILTATP